LTKSKSGKFYLELNFKCVFWFSQNSRSNLTLVYFGIFSTIRSLSKGKIISIGVYNTYLVFFPPQVISNQK